MGTQRILFVACFRRGGVQQFCEILMRQLSPHFDGDVLVIGRVETGTLLAKAVDVGRTMWALASRIRSKQVDVIHFNIPFRIRSLARESLHVLVARQLSFLDRSVIFFHGWDVQLGTRIARSPMFSSIIRLVYGQAAQIFVLYENCKLQLVSMGIDPGRISVTTSTYEATPVTIESTALHASFEILFMSRLVEGKGVMEAARVAAMLRDDGMNFRLIVAGEGPMEEPLADFVVEHDLETLIETTGYVTGERKAELLRRSDIFLLPTRLDEGCPISILEAMGAGLAVVSSARGAIPDIVEDGPNGFVIGDDTVESFYRAVKALMIDPPLLAKIQAANSQKAASNFEAREFTRKMELVYESLTRPPQHNAHSDADPLAGPRP